MMVRENTDIPYRQYRKLLSKKPMKDSRKHFAKVKDARIEQYRILAEEDIPDIDFLEIAEYNKLDEGYVYTIRNYDKFSFEILARRAIKTKYDGYVMEVESNGKIGERAGKGNDGKGSQHEGYETGNRMPGYSGSIRGDAGRGQKTENVDQERGSGNSNGDNGQSGTVKNSDRDYSYESLTSKPDMVVTTGGTIACTAGDQGLQPQSSDIMHSALEQLRRFYDITVRDMTSEAAMTKLMWALGQGMNQAQIADLFRQNLAGEITL